MCGPLKISRRSKLGDSWRHLRESDCGDPKNELKLARHRREEKGCQAEESSCAKPEGKKVIEHLSNSL